MLNRNPSHLIAIEVRLFVAVHCWIWDSVFLPGPSNLETNYSNVFFTKVNVDLHHLVKVEDGCAGHNQENVAGLRLETDGDHGDDDELGGRNSTEPAACILLLLISVESHSVRTL